MRWEGHELRWKRNGHCGHLRWKRKWEGNQRRKEKWNREQMRIALEICVKRASSVLVIWCFALAAQNVRKPAQKHKLKQRAIKLLRWIWGHLRWKRRRTKPKEKWSALEAQNEEEASVKGNGVMRWKRKEREASVMSACSSNAMCAGSAKKITTSVMSALEVGELRLKRKRRKRRWNALRWKRKGWNPAQMNKMQNHAGSVKNKDSSVKCHLDKMKRVQIDINPNDVYRSSFCLS